MAEITAPALQALPSEASARQSEPRLEAVLEVLAGVPVAEAARRWAVEPVVLDRWVETFVEAGTAAVTNRPRAHEAALRDRFLLLFAHELRTPLTVAQGWAEMLLAGEVPQARTAEAGARLQGALQRLAGKVCNLQLLAEAALGRLEPSPRIVTVADLVARHPDLQGLSGSGLGVPLRVDPELFAQVLRDLWEATALHSRPRGRQVVVTDRPPWTEVRVVRCGPPVPLATLQALFEPFHSVDDATGVTTGLYLARALVVAHGGTLGAEQDDDGTLELWVRVPSAGGTIPRRSHGLQARVR